MSARRAESVAVARAVVGGVEVGVVRAVDQLAHEERGGQVVGAEEDRDRSDPQHRGRDELGEAGIYLLEVNTQPGMTPLSLVPEQAKLKGVSYGELVERLIEEALPKGSGQ